MDSKDLPLKGLRSAESEIIVSGNVEASELSLQNYPSTSGWRGNATDTKTLNVNVSYLDKYLMIRQRKFFFP